MSHHFDYTADERLDISDAYGVSKGAVSSVSLTAAGHFIGTPDYSAPEQIQGLPVDGRTDQYALACVAYQLLTGATPFERDQGMAVLLAHLSQPPPSAGSLRPDLPGAADEVLARGMAKVPEKRFESADFHDREDFSVLFHIKVFAIMKFSLLSSD
jgi:serine/threonine protein kinase